jgi:hypothetical protein
MITFHQALEAACSVVERTGPGDLVVELKEGAFKTTVFFVTAEDRRLDYVVEVAVDAESGKVLTKEDGGLVHLLQPYPVAGGWDKFLSAKQAYDIAMEALRGFREYDERGRLTVQLRGDVYYVTFPLIPITGGSSRSADFAIQVHVDARTGKVVKLLAAS